MVINKHAGIFNGNISFTEISNIISLHRKVYTPKEISRIVKRSESEVEVIINHFLNGDFPWVDALIIRNEPTLPKPTQKQDAPSGNKLTESKYIPTYSKTTFDGSVVIVEPNQRGFKRRTTPHLPLASIKRIADRGGVQRIGIPAAEIISVAAAEWIKNVTHIAEKYAVHAKRKTVKPEDIVAVVREMGINIQIQAPKPKPTKPLRTAPKVPPKILPKPSKEFINNIEFHLEHAQSHGMDVKPKAES